MSMNRLLTAAVLALLATYLTVAAIERPLHGGAMICWGP
jgi:hypothetical protein